MVKASETTVTDAEKFQMRKFLYNSNLKNFYRQAKLWHSFRY